MSVDVVFLASEFPNDNPALHGGVIWVCLEPTAHPTPELVPRPPARAIAIADALAEPPPVETMACEPPFEVVDAAALDDAPLVIEELTPIDAALVVEACGTSVVFESVAPPTANDSSALPPPSDDPFMTLVCTLADVAIGAGSPHIAALLPGLMFDARVPDVLDDATANALKAAGIWNGDAVEPAFARTVAAWRAILRGTSDDFSACSVMLDEWTSDLLARLLDARAAAPRLRQELRTRGIAAFGLA